jgi:hypothetical protein
MQNGGSVTDMRYRGDDKATLRDMFNGMRNAKANRYGALTDAMGQTGGGGYGGVAPWARR